MSRRSEVVFADAAPIQPAFPGKRPDTGWPSAEWTTKNDKTVCIDAREHGRVAGTACV